MGWIRQCIIGVFAKGACRIFCLNTAPVFVETKVIPIVFKFVAREHFQMLGGGGAHTGFYNGRGRTLRLGLKAAMGPKVIPPKTENSSDLVHYCFG